MISRLKFVDKRGVEFETPGVLKHINVAKISFELHSLLELKFPGEILLSKLVLRPRNLWETLKIHFQKGQIQHLTEF